MLPSLVSYRHHRAVLGGNAPAFQASLRRRRMMMKSSPSAGALQASVRGEEALAQHRPSTGPGFAT